jgi:thiamine kinase
MTGPAPSLRRAVLARLPALRAMPWSALSGGRSNRLWRVGPVVIKSYDRAAASPLFPNDPVAEARALSNLGPQGLAPRLVAVGAGWLAYGFVEGDVWNSDPAPVARHLFQLHRARRPLFRVAPMGSAAVLAAGQRIARHCAGPLPPAPPDPGVAPPPAPRLIHGDAVPGNVITGPDGVTLIDWQCPALGDPAEDLATFLSPAMQLLYRGNVLTHAEAEAFLAAYPDPQVIQRYRLLAPLYRWRIAAHCLWKSERGAADYGKALKLELAAP